MVGGEEDGARGDWRKGLGVGVGGVDEGKTARLLGVRVDST